MKDAQRSHLEQLQLNYQRRLHALEEQAAILGFSTPPEIRIEIEDIQAKLSNIGQQPNQSLTIPGESEYTPAPSKPILLDAITRRFTLEDLESLCLEVEAEITKLGDDSQEINLEIVGGKGKRGIALNLIEHLDRRGYLDLLVSAIRRARPGIV